MKRKLSMNHVSHFCALWLEKRTRQRGRCLETNEPKILILRNLRNLRHPILYAKTDTKYRRRCRCDNETEGKFITHYEEFFIGWDGSLSFTTALQKGKKENKIKLKWPVNNVFIFRNQYTSCINICTPVYPRVFLKADSLHRWTVPDLAKDVLLNRWCEFFCEHAHTPAHSFMLHDAFLTSCFMLKYPFLLGNDTQCEYEYEKQ